MSTPMATRLETGQISSQPGLNGYSEQDKVQFFRLEGEDPMFTRHPNVLDVDTFKLGGDDPRPDPISNEMAELRRDDSDIVAGSVESAAAGSLNTEYPSALEDEDEDEDSGSDHDDCESDSEGYSPVDSEPEMTEVDPGPGLDPSLTSEERREEQDLKIHALAANIHHLLEKGKELKGLTPEEEEMMRALEESDAFISDLGSDFTSIQDSGVSAEADSSEVYPTSPPLSSPDQSNQEYFGPESLMPPSILPTTTDNSLPTRGLSPPLTSQSAQEASAPAGSSSELGSVTKRLSAIGEHDFGPLSPRKNESDDKFKNRLDGI